MKNTLLILMFLMALAIPALAQSSPVADLSLTDMSGKTVSLNDIKGPNGAVLIFVSAQCPVVRGYNERMNEIAAAYKTKGINVVGVNSNITESAEQIKAHADATYKFPVFIDKGAGVADKFGASVTPEAYFLDAKNTLIYHGAIDNDRSGANVTEHFLTAAFDASLTGRKITRSSANAFGCTIKRSVE
jgi:peroxiredoxin